MQTQLASAAGTSGVDFRIGCSPAYTLPPTYVIHTKSRPTNARKDGRKTSARAAGAGGRPRLIMIGHLGGGRGGGRRGARMKPKRVGGAAPPRRLLSGAAAGSPHPSTPPVPGKATSHCPEVSPAHL